MQNRLNRSCLGIFYDLSKEEIERYLSSISKFTCHIILYPWNNTPIPDDMFSEIDVTILDYHKDYSEKDVRKLLWNKALSCGISQIILLDSHEWVSEDSIEGVKNVLNSFSNNLYCARKYHLDYINNQYFESFYYQSHFRYQPLFFNVSDLQMENNWTGVYSFDQRLPDTVYRNYQAELLDEKIFFSSKEHVFNEHITGVDKSEHVLTGNQYLSDIYLDSKYKSIENLSKSDNKSDNKSENKTVLIGCSVRKPPVIVKSFLENLHQYRLDTIDIKYVFIDDNIDSQSSELLKNFAQDHGNVEIYKAETSHESLQYTQRVESVFVDKLSYQTVCRVAKNKNKILQKGRDVHADFCFIVDSDILLHPNTLNHLMSQNREVVAPLVWTRLHDGFMIPNTWSIDDGLFFDIGIENVVSYEDAVGYSLDFINDMKNPQLKKVGGVSGAVLLSREILNLSINFDLIKYLRFEGDYSHFCTKVYASNYSVYLDSNYQGIHLSEASQLEEEIEEYLCTYKGW